MIRFVSLAFLENADQHAILAQALFRQPRKPQARHEGDLNVAQATVRKRETAIPRQCPVQQLLSGND